jgi:hypothetical protein
MKFNCEKNQRSFHFHRRYENARGVIHKCCFISKEDNLFGHFYVRKYLGLPTYVSQDFLYRIYHGNAKGNIYKCFLL